MIFSILTILELQDLWTPMIPPIPSNLFTHVGYMTWISWLAVQALSIFWLQFRSLYYQTRFANFCNILNWTVSSAIRGIVAISSRQLEPKLCFAIPSVWLLLQLSCGDSSLLGYSIHLDKYNVWSLITFICWFNLMGNLCHKYLPVSFELKVNLDGVGLGMLIGRNN